MIGRRYKQRVKIDHVYSQILQIIQFIQNSLKIPSIEIPDVHGLWGTVPVIYFFHMLINIGIFPCDHVIGRISVTESVHKDLIHNRAFGPVRCFKSRNNPEAVMLIDFPGNAYLIIIAVDLSGNNLKIIADGLTSQFYICSVIVKTIFGLHPLHRLSHIIIY